MKILLIILSIIGLLKLVSLFILCIVEVCYKIKGIYIDGIKRTSGIYTDTAIHLIPDIKLGYSNGYFDITISWLNIIYYSCYSIDKNKDEDEK